MKQFIEETKRRIEYHNSEADRLKNLVKSIQDECVHEYPIHPDKEWYKGKIYICKNCGYERNE